MVGFFPAELVSAMRAFRYFIYLGLIVLCFVSAWHLMRQMPAWVALLVLMPALMHLTYRSLSLCRWAHVVEAVLLPLLVFSSSGSYPLAWVTLAIQIMCYSALWGISSTPTLTSLAVVCLALIDSLAEVTLLQIAWMPLVLVVVLLLGEIVHRRSSGLASNGRRLWRENRTLRRYLPNKLADSDEGLQRMWLVVTFIDLSGFSRASLTMAPEALAEILNDFFNQATQQINQSGGEVIKFLGDGLLCAFPGDHSRADTALAAMRSVAGVTTGFQALNQRWQQRGHGMAFNVHSGVAAGYCTVGHWGSNTRRDYSVIGSSVNLASRLSERAQGAEILVDSVVARLVGVQHFDGPDEIKLKGMGKIQAYKPLPGMAWVC